MARRKLNVAILLPDDRFGKKLPVPAFGAAPTALLQGFEELGADSVEVHVVSCVIGSVPAPEKLADNIRYHQIVLPKWSFLRSLHLGPILAVRRKLREIRPDLVHSQGIERWCAVAGCLSGYPAVLTIHGHLRLIHRVTPMKPRMYWMPQMLLGEIAVRLHRGVICISDHIAAAVHGQARRTWMIPNALRKQFFEPGARKPGAGGKPRILVIGTIVENKRPLEILRVLESLHRKGFGFEALFLGELSEQGVYQREFRSLMDRAEALGYARYGGKLGLDDLIAQMDSSDALIHFPMEEAFGLVVAESLARGLKLFAAEVGGVPEIALGISGADVLRSGNFEGLKVSLESWMKQGAPLSPSSAAMMSERYLPRHIAEEHLNVYHGVLEGSGSAGSAVDRP